MRKPLRIIIKLSVAVLLIGGAVYYFGFVDSGIWRNFLSRLFPCSQPITYSIGNFDTRFDISKADFIKDLAEAESVWEKPIGRQLFTYVEQGGALTINLIYDMRQESTVKLQRLGIVIHDDQASYDSLKAKFTTLSATYRQRKAALDSSVASFENKKKKFEQEVARWNAKGGAPPPEYKRLKQEQDDLNAQAEKIYAEETSLNLLVDTLNSMVAVLNRLAKSLNQNIVDFNGTGLVGTGEFEEGEYVLDNKINEINVYQFDDQTSLIRLLAHELGHALRLPHVEDTQAIMYRLNNGTNEKLTPDDLELLKTQCGIK
ncbi:matrixin family metalloprotease [Candidatus Uhrbacteria bacterium]|nr:matrixin family metalloprotease [Candidatus Uhrbacteria bacterium]